MKRYYHTCSDFIMNEDGKNTFIVPNSDGNDELYDASQDPQFNSQVNLYLSQWPGMDISMEQFNKELQAERIEACKRAKEAKMFLESMYPIDRIRF